MERNLHNDDFERLLREKSDEFRMYPSKRIWHSIYNNIHPGRKWPSVAMSITLISVLLIMGYLNTRNASGIYISAIDNTAGQTENLQPSFISTINTEHKEQVIVNDQQPYFEDPYHIKAKGTNLKKIPLNPKVIAARPAGRNAGLSFSRQDKKDADANKTENSGLSVNIQAVSEDTTNFNETSIASIDKLNEPATDIISFDNLTPELFETGNLSIMQKAPFVDVQAAIQLNDIVIQQQNKPASINDINIASFEKDMLALTKTENIAAADKEWIENYAMYNKPAKKKWANKLAWQSYATPSVVYRTLSADHNFSNAVNTTPFAVSPTSQDINTAVTQTPSIGFELGSGLQYSILKVLKIKAGLQLNYTRYNSHAFQNSHPVATTITMHDLQTNSSYEVYRSTSYANRIGFEAAILHNETFQIALPLGADLKVLGSGNMQWNIGFSIQPTYVAGGKSYLISSDRHNYVQETSMLRHWNLNAGFETFVSYKVNGLTWQIGPQFRTQLFTTNTKRFAVEEKLQTYGLKIGVSKTLK